MQELIERLERREARIGIFGLGYVGLPLMLRFVEVGYRVLGFDLVLGIAYKKNVDDRRESPAIEIMELLRRQGAVVSYSDPHVPRFEKMRRHDFDLESVALTPESLAAVEAVLIATDHDRFDYELIREHARLIVDTRGVYREPAEHIVKA